MKTDDISFNITKNIISNNTKILLPEAALKKVPTMEALDSSCMSHLLGLGVV